MGSLIFSIQNLIRFAAFSATVAACASSWAQLNPLCKAMMSKRSYDEAASLIAQTNDVNIGCGSSGSKVALPLDFAIESAAINPMAPDLAALLLAKGAMVGGYRKDVFFFRDPKRQQEFDSKPAGVPFAITPEETQYTMYTWKTYIEKQAEISRQEFLERARQQDRETIAAFGKVLLGVAGSAAAYQALKHGGPSAMPQAIDNSSARSGRPVAPQPIQPSTSGDSSNTRVAKVGGSLATTGEYPGGSGHGDSSPSSPRPKKLYPLVRHSTYPTLGNTEQEACANATKKVDEHIANGTLGTIINRAACSCTREALVVGSSMIQCKIAVTNQLMVDYDPGATTSNSSR